MTPCSIDDCTRDAKARGWCNAHWLRWYRWGDPLGSAPRPTLIERLLARIDVLNGCWVWQGYISAEGYGRLMVKSTVRWVPGYTHRIAYEFFVGSIPDGFEVDHLCRNRACCNPDHLEAVEHIENVHRGASMVLASRCGRGHEFNDENTYRTPNGRRFCRTCRRDRRRERRAEARLQRVAL